MTEIVKRFEDLQYAVMYSVPDNDPQYGQLPSYREADAGEATIATFILQVGWFGDPSVDKQLKDWAQLANLTLSSKESMKGIVYCLENAGALWPVWSVRNIGQIEADGHISAIFYVFPVLQAYLY